MHLFDELRYPIIQGGMANISTYELASAVSQAGGLGVIGTGGWDASKTEKEIKKMKKKVGSTPFGVNVMLMNPHADEIIDVCIKQKVRYVTTGAGNPSKYISKLKEADIIVLPVVPSVALAKRMEKIGADGVIVEGTESGGHVGEATTLALIPQVCDAVNIPVIAAGGIACNRQFVAAIALGAVGVQIGTALLATCECPIHDNYKALIVEAKDTSTMVTGRVKGVPVRSLKTKMTREYQKLESTDVLPLELEKLTLGSLKKAVIDGNIEEGSFMAGQVSGMINQIRPVADVLADICNCQKTLEHLESRIHEINSNQK